MKKRIITVAAFAACLALCAAVWPRNEPAGETPALSTPAAVIATQPRSSEDAGNERSYNARGRKVGSNTAGTGRGS